MRSSDGPLAQGRQRGRAELPGERDERVVVPVGRAVRLGHGGERRAVRGTRGARGAARAPPSRERAARCWSGRRRPGAPGSRSGAAAPRWAAPGRGSCPTSSRSRRTRTGPGSSPARRQRGRSAASATSAPCRQGSRGRARTRGGAPGSRANQSGWKRLRAWTRSTAGASAAARRPGAGTIEEAESEERREEQEEQLPRRVEHVVKRGVEVGVRDEEEDDDQRTTRAGRQPAGQEAKVATTPAPPRSRGAGGATPPAARSRPRPGARGRRGGSGRAAGRAGRAGPRQVLDERRPGQELPEVGPDVEGAADAFQARRAPRRGRRPRESRRAAGQAPGPLPPRAVRLRLHALPDLAERRPAR